MNNLLKGMKPPVLAGVLVLAALVILAVVIYPRLRISQEVAAPPYWPTQGWQSVTPEGQGFDSAKLANALLTIREKNIRVHSLLLIRNGYAFVDAAFYPPEPCRAALASALPAPPRGAGRRPSADGSSNEQRLLVHWPVNSFTACEVPNLSAALARARMASTSRSRGR